jgi:hypothetical protein
MEREAKDKLRIIVPIAKNLSTDGSYFFWKPARFQVIANQISQLHINNITIDRFQLDLQSVKLRL